jgi:biopolymer transport protein ExbB
VFGILKALISVGPGQPSIDTVAVPVGEALIMTGIGLAVAVPALLGYNILVRRNNAIRDSLRDFTGDLEANLVGGLRPDFGHGVRTSLVTRK